MSSSHRFDTSLHHSAPIDSPQVTSQQEVMGGVIPEGSPRLHHCGMFAGFPNEGSRGRVRNQCKPTSFRYTTAILHHFEQDELVAKPVLEWAWESCNDKMLFSSTPLFAAADELSSDHPADNRKLNEGDTDIHG